MIIIIIVILLVVCFSAICSSSILSLAGGGGGLYFLSGDGEGGGDSGDSGGSGGTGGSSSPPTDDSNYVKYDTPLRIFNPDGTYGGYLSPCGSSGGCGPNVTMRPDSNYNSTAVGGDSSQIRDWKIIGKSASEPIKYGDIIQIKGQSTKWTDTDKYLTPCGRGATGCGINVTLRPDSDYNSTAVGGDSSKVRDWLVSGGTNGTIIKYNDEIKLTGQSTKWNGTNLPLSLCGSSGGCGINVTMRPENSANIYKTWQFKKLG
jgi:hypothetical protein